MLWIFGFVGGFVVGGVGFSSDFVWIVLGCWCLLVLTVGIWFCGIVLVCV